MKAMGAWFIMLLAGVMGVSTVIAAEPLRIGATVSETGHFASEVGSFRALLEAWAETVNGEGGIRAGGERRPLEIRVYDDRSDEAAARRMYERLAVVDRVHLMIGPYSSPLTFAASTAAENHGIPFLAVCANSPRIYSRGNRWIACVIDEAPRYTYRYWEMLEAEGKAGTVFFVVEDTMHPQGVYEGAKVLAEAAGLRVLGGRVAPRDCRDFSSVLGEIRALDPDIVFVSANIPFAVQFMSQARESHLHPREFHAIHHSGVFRRSLGEGAEHVTGQSYWTPGMTLGRNERFQEILARSGVDPEDYPWAPAYMMAFEVVEAALTGAGTAAPGRLMQEILSSEIETIGGVVRFQPNGVGSINTYPSQIRNARHEIVWPPEKATSTHLYPAPSR
ncbi:MAG: amino acid ABC transporter substrate-binding protein [Deltaproteobacteria bacterium]|nr:amino acid ABC transporter substrate-binding protein [Deltaproteobacteria bacterium]